MEKKAKALKPSPPTPAIPSSPNNNNGINRQWQHKLSSLPYDEFFTTLTENLHVFLPFKVPG